MLTLDVPIALGIVALYAQSAFEIVSGRGNGYLDSLAGLVFFLLCGRAFQQKTHERLAFDRDYKSFFPLAVTRRSKSEIRNSKSEIQEERVSLAQLAVGDRLLIRNQELIPADSTLASASALIDYSFVTGESAPVAKRRGDYLYAGGKQVGRAIEVETTKPVSQSYLTSLWNHEAFRKNRDSNFNSLTNRYSRWFTLVVMAMAFGAGIFWSAQSDFARGLKAFTSVLIVACPCALALAAPFALGTAQRWLARMNVFVKNTLVLERMADVNAIVFDKTGTLTAAGGERTLEFVGAAASDSSAPGSSRNDSIGLGGTLGATERVWIASLSRHSSHPLSVRIAESLATNGCAQKVSSFSEVSGSGILGSVNGHEIRLGSAQWLRDCGSDAPQAQRRPSNEDSQSGRVACAATGSTVHVAIDGRYRGAFVLPNTLRPEVAELVKSLGLRFQLALLSGDNEREQENFSTLFGGDTGLHFNQSPLDKLNFVRAQQRSGNTVMMVGDGLNDAGALKQSDVGVAVVENVGAFSPASDVILAAACVPRLDAILRFARNTARIVRLSFGISAVYNVVGVAFAAAGILSPLVCAILMPLSSVSVVLFACSVTSWAARKTIPKPEALRACLKNHE